MTRQGWTEERRVKFRHTANAKRLARGEPPILEPAPDDHLDEMPVALKEDMSVNLKQQIEFLPVRRRAALPVPVLMQPTSAVFEFANNQPCVQDFVEVWRVQYSDMRLVECTLYKDTTMLRIRMMLDEPLPHDASLED